MFEKRKNSLPGNNEVAGFRLTRRQKSVKEQDPGSITQKLPHWVKYLPPDLLFDSHCHLDCLFIEHLPQMELESYEEVLHAFPTMKKLSGVITSFCQPSLWSSLLYPPSNLVLSMFTHIGHNYTVGVHPHFASQLLERPNMIRQLHQLLSEPGVVGLGEVGLDGSKGNVMDEQMEAFKLQVKLAMELKLPLMMSVRNAEAEAVSVLDSVELPRDWPIHRQWCGPVGPGSWAVCSAWLARFPASVVGLTEDVCEEGCWGVAGLLPLDRLVLQSDAPHTAISGQFLLPVHLLRVAERVSKLRNLSPETVLRASRDNVRRIYRV